MPLALAPYARPLDTGPQVADVWRMSLDGAEIATASTGLTEPSVLRRMLGADPMTAVFEQGVLPFATLRVDLAALAGSALPSMGHADAWNRGRERA